KNQDEYECCAHCHRGCVPGALSTAAPVAAQPRRRLGRQSAKRERPNVIDKGNGIQMRRCGGFAGVVRIALVAALAGASDCAARDSRFASRFVKPGEPTATYDDPAAAPQKPTLSEYVRKLRALQAKGGPKNSLLPKIESRNPELARALVLLAMHESAENHRLAAAAYRKAGVLDFAYRHFQRAVVLDPCDAVSYDGLARLVRDWGMSDLALSEVHRALKCHKKSAEIYNTLGTVLESLGQS